MKEAIGKMAIPDRYWNIIAIDCWKSYKTKKQLRFCVTA
jgi:hypothetical protein